MLINNRLMPFALASFCGLFMLYHETSGGIKCWVCNSFNDLGCGDPFDNSSFPITDCDAEYNKRENLKNVKATMCRKLVQKVNGKWRFIRSCAFLGEPGIGGDERFCRRYTGNYNIYTEDCLCRSKDGCNSGISLGVGKFFPLALATTMILVNFD